MPRTPRNGFASLGLVEVGDRLVGARVERADQQRTAAERLGRLAYAASCSCSSGIADRPMNRNSVRNSPTPSAPAATARTASTGEPMFAATSIVTAVDRAGRFEGRRLRLRTTRRAPRARR